MCRRDAAARAQRMDRGARRRGARRYDDELPTPTRKDGSEVVLAGGNCCARDLFSRPDRQGVKHWQGCGSNGKPRSSRSRQKSRLCPGRQPAERSYCLKRAGAPSPQAFFQLTSELCRPPVVVNRMQRGCAVTTCRREPGLGPGDSDGTMLSLSSLATNRKCPRRIHEESRRLTL